jgi:hypothetical protein
MSAHNVAEAIQYQGVAYCAYIALTAFTIVFACCDAMLPFPPSSQGLASNSQRLHTSVPMLIILQAGNRYHYAAVEATILLDKDIVHGTKVLLMIVQARVPCRRAGASPPHARPSQTSLSTRVLSPRICACLSCISEQSPAPGGHLGWGLSAAS